MCDERPHDASEPKRQRIENRNYVYNKRIDRQHQPGKLKKKSGSVENHTFMDESKTIIIDNGAYSIKTDYATKSEPMIIPNCIMKAKAERKRLFIGNQIDECRDCSGLFYLLPCERGYITKWEVQKPIWDQIFNRTLGSINDKDILMTQPLFNFKNIQDCIDEIFFEEYEVNSMYRCNPSDLVALKYGAEKGMKNIFCVVVDSGYSFTHIIPYINGVKCSNAIKRLQIGGKMLTNHMKDILSYRQYHVMEETYVINQVKEDTCFVSEDFKNDLRIASEHGDKNHIVKNYILPDFNTIRRGYIQDFNNRDENHENCQVLKLNNERFAVPEILFTPSDIGISSVGLVDCIIDSIKLCPVNYQEILAKNIVVVGGNALLPGFKNRLIKEFQSKMPTTWKVGVTIPEKSVIYAWQGGKNFLNSRNCDEMFVTKKEYEEIGSTGIQKKFNEFAIFKSAEKVKKATYKPVNLIEHVKKLKIFKREELFGDNDDLNDEEINDEDEAAGIHDESCFPTPPLSEKSSMTSLNAGNVQYFFEDHAEEDNAFSNDNLRIF